MNINVEKPSKKKRYYILSKVLSPPDLDDVYSMSSIHEVTKFVDPKGTIFEKMLIKYAESKNPDQNTFFSIDDKEAIQ